MACFHFNTANGTEYPDPDGTELAGIPEAQVEAIKVLSDFMRDDAQRFWETRSFSVTCTDDSGLVLFSVDVSATAAPILLKETGPKPS